MPPYDAVAQWQGAHKTSQLESVSLPPRAHVRMGIPGTDGLTSAQIPAHLNRYHEQAELI
jgi:hypothetical protein